MKTNYIFKARWLQGAASANESKKMQVNPRITPFRFACALLLFLTLSIGNAWADYTVGFATSGSTVIASGGDYVSDATRGGSTYIETDGLRFGKGSGKGSITVTLTSSGTYVGQIKASKITLKDVKRYGSDASVGVKTTVTYTDDATTVDNYTAPNSASDHDISLTSSKTIKSVKIESTTNGKRFYCKGFTVVAAAASHTLSSAVSPTASGSVSLGATSVAEGATTTATATPAAHYTFTSWSISGTGASLSSTTTNPTTVTMGSTDATVTATFTAVPKASITLSEAGSTTTDATTYYVGDEYTLPTTTTASCGTKVLVGWSKVTVPETNTKPTSNYYEKGAKVTLAASQTFYAVFAVQSGSAPVAASTEFTYASHTGWTIGGSNEDKGSYYLLKAPSGNHGYIESPTISDLSTVTSVVVHAGFFGGASYGTFEVYGGATQYGDAESPENKNDNEFTISPATNPLSGSGTIKIINAGSTSSDNGTRLFSATVNYATGGYTYSKYSTSCVAPTSFNVTYNANGDGAGGSTGTTGSVPEDDTDYSSGATVTVLGKNTLAKAGHTFAGWNTAANGSGASYDEDDTFTITANVTLYAQWEINTYTVTWHVGDDDSNTSTVDYNTEFQDISVGKPSVDNDDLSSCESNYFVGWVKASGVRTTDGGTVSLYNDNKVNATDKITSDTHFYAMFATASASSNSSSISSYQDGTYYLIDSHTYGGTTTYYSPTGTASGQISSVELTDVVSVTSGVLTLDLSSNLLTEDMQYTITAVAGTPTKYTIYNASTDKYIGASTSTSFTNTSTNKWELITEDKRFMFWYDQTTDRALLYQHSYNNSGTQTYGKRFGCYSKSNAGVTDAQSGKEQYGSGYLFLVPISNTTYSDYRTGCPVATCGTPTSLTVGATVTKTGATISWTGSATGTLDHYEYAYWIDGEDEPTSGFTNNSKNTSATLSGLYSNVKYNWKVRQVCTGDDNSKWAKSYFTTSAANLTYSVPEGVSAVSTPATNASNLTTADVPSSCGSCWTFAGWTTAVYPDNSAAPANFFPAGTKARVSGDATLYAVYSRIEYKMIGETTGLVANDNYVLTLATTAGDEFAMSNEAQETYTYEIARTDVTDRCHEYVDGFYVYNVGANNIWKFTGTASSGQLYNAAADKYINLSSTAGNTTSMLGTSDNLTFTADGVYWTIHSTKYLHPYSASGGGWEAVASGSWDAAEDFSGYLYHQNDATYSTAPGCGTYSVTWKVAGSEYTTGTPTTSTNTCTGVEALPTNPADNALGCADVFRGWSESELTGTGNGAPSDLFDYAGDAPDIDENTVFHAVFATVASGSLNTTTHTMNNSGSINSNWEGNNRTQKADSYASKAAWQMMGYSSDANPEGELNTKSTYTNVAGVTINVAASNATTVTLYYSANKSSWTEVSAVKVSQNSSSYTDYSFNFSSMPKTAVYLKLVNSTNSLYVYQVKITTDSRTFNNYTTYCTNVYNDATNDHKWSTTGNWSNGHVPTINERASIQKPVTVDVQTAKAKNVMLMQNSTNTGQLIIDAGNELTVAETVRKTTDGSTDTSTGENDIIFNSNEDDGLGALVMGTHDGTNKATVNFYTKSTGKKEQNTSVAQYVGTPFNDENNILYNWYNSWMYRIKYTSNVIGWERVNENEKMNPFEGYCVFSADAWGNASGHSYWQQGTLVSSDNHTCSSLNWKSGVGTANENNENLLANSWMAPIHINAFESGDFVKTVAAIYIFNSTSKSAYTSLASNYETFTPGAAEDDDVIPSMQSFSVFTNATGGSSVTLDYKKLVYDPAIAGVTTDPNFAPRRSIRDDKPDKMRLYINSENGYGDMLYLLEREDFAEGFENGWDGPKLFGESVAPQLYAITPDGNMAINCVPDWEGTVVGFRAGTEDNQYTFSFEYDGNQTWYLNDLKAEESTRIMSGNTYAFSTADSDMEARFIISATPISYVPTAIENGEAETSIVRKLLINDHVYIIRHGRMYDATGVMIK